MDRPGYELAPRIVLGHTSDCLLGWEIAFTGPYNWYSHAVRTSAEGYPAPGLQPL